MLTFDSAPKRLADTVPYLDLALTRARVLARAAHVGSGAPTLSARGAGAGHVGAMRSVGAVKIDYFGSPEKVG